MTDITIQPNYVKVFHKFFLTRFLTASRIEWQITALFVYQNADY